MLEWNQYSHLHVVRNLRNLIGGWWNSDIFFINNQGQFLTPISEKYFYNDLVSYFFKNSSVQENLFKFLKNKTSESKEPVLLEWEETGLNVLAVPIFKDKNWTGLVGVTGFITNNHQLKKIQTVLHRNQIQTTIHTLDKSALFYMKEIVISFVQEMITFNEMQKSEKSMLNNFSKNSPSYNGILGESPIMKQLYSFLDKIKYSDSNVLIQGENGTGKEMVAQTIYKNSLRQKEAFVVQNCSAFNDNLLESELFGHVKGAFTGAIQDKKGLFELSDKGTFFLDEIGDTSLAMQTKLLRVLQDGTFFPVGSVKEKKVNVRIIAATNKDLSQMIQQGSFREDLYYRLNVINIKIPPLRDRGNDIVLLAKYFIYQVSKGKNKAFEEKVLKLLQSYHWPGNIRELQNEIQRLFILSHDKERITVDMLSDKLLESQSEESFINQNDNLKKAIEKLERKMIGKCLKQESWNKTKVAKKLGISRAALISKVKTYHLEKEEGHSFKTKAQ